MEATHHLADPFLEGLNRPKAANTVISMHCRIPITSSEVRNRMVESSEWPVVAASAAFRKRRNR
jgi:hypothetical protein